MALKYWVYKSLISLKNIVSIIDYFEILNIYEEYNINNIKNLLHHFLFFCERRFNNKKQTDKNRYIFENIPFELISFDEESEKNVINQDINFRDNIYKNIIENIYQMNKNRRILLAPNNNFVRKIKLNYNKYFLTVNRIIEILYKKRMMINNITARGNKKHSVDENIKYNRFTGYIIGPVFRKYTNNLSTRSEIIKTCEEMNLRIVSPENIQNGQLIGFCFENQNNLKYSYTITYHSMLIDTNTDIWKHPLDSIFFGGFYLSKISVIQDLIDTLIMKIHFEKDILYNKKYIGSQPDNCYEKHRTFIMSSYVIPMLVFVACLPSLGYIINYLTNERNCYLLDYYKIKNINIKLYLYLNRLIDYFISLIPFIPVIITIRLFGLIRFTNYAIIFLYFVTAVFAINAMFFLFAYNFNIKSIGMVVGIMSMTIGSIISGVGRLYIFNKSSLMNKIMYLLFHVPLSRFFDAMLYTEFYFNRGLIYDDLFLTSNRFERYPMLFDIFMLLFDGLIYIILEYFALKVVKNISTLNNKNIKYINQNENVNKDEIENELIIPSVELDKISVTYDYKTHIFKNLSIKMYSNKIYIILGENGSGKSTFIKTIMGILKPVSGNIILRSQKKSIATVGFCPQHDILMQNMTVKEHLTFYYNLITDKTESLIKKEINELVNKIGLKHIANSLAKNLSGGEKRKLCIGISFINEPDIIILDEPTSSVDPGSRESIYDLIIQNRKDKTVIITTHHVEEAEILGDEILFLIFGKFIKQGFYIDLISKYSPSTKFCIEFKSKIDNFLYLFKDIQKINSNIENIIQKNNYIIILLNINYKKDNKIIHLIDYFLNMYNEQKIKSISFNDASIEEVFINIFKQNLKNSIKDEKDFFYNDAIHFNNSLNMDHSKVIKMLQTRVQTPIMISHIFIMVKRRIFYNLKNKIFYILQFFIPIILTIISCLIEKYLANSYTPEIINNMNEFSERTQFIIPIRHDFIYNESNINHVLIQIVNDYIGIDKNTLISYLSNKTLYDLCEFKNLNICEINKTPMNNIKTFSSNFPTYTNKNGNYKILLIHKCSIDNFLMLTKYLYSYKILFSLNFRENANYLELPRIEIYNMQEAPLGIPFAINYLNNILFKLNSVENTTLYPEINMKFNVLENGFFHRLRSKLIMYPSLEIIIECIFIIICSNFLISPINEYITGFKRTQLNLGISQTSYWISFYIVDWIFYLFSIILCLILFGIFNVRGLSENDSMKLLFISLIIFGSSMITLMYILTFFVKSTSIGYLSSIIFPIMILFLSYIASETNSNDLFDDKNDINRINIFKYYLGRFLSITPYYNFYKIIHLLLHSKIHWSTKLQLNNIYFELKSLSIISIILIFILLLKIYFVDHIKISSLETRLYKLFSINDESNEIDDEDVIEEKKFIHKKSMKDNSILTIKNLNKYYITNVKNIIRHACKDVNFSLRINECFGVLGKNGAGKSTIFKIIVDDMLQSSGQIIKKNQNNRIYITYCPQTDNYDYEMTPFSILFYLCKIYGYNIELSKNIVNDLLKAFGLKKFTNVKIKHMSFGNKRKLSCAMCCIGNPAVILLDEPTSGVDPSARNLIWNFLSELKKNGTSILFTSHSMRECEIYAERIAIMIDGKIKCIGSPEHIKNKYGFGYEISISCSNIHYQKIREKISFNYPDSKVLYSTTCLKYLIPISFSQLSNLFRMLEELNEDIPDINIHINQSRLETIFQYFESKNDDK